MMKLNKYNLFTLGLIISLVITLVVWLLRLYKENAYLGAYLAIASSISAAYTSRVVARITNFWAKILGSAIEQNKSQRKELAERGRMNKPTMIVVIPIMLAAVSLLRLYNVEGFNDTGIQFSIVNFPLGLIAIIVAGASGYDAINDVIMNKRFRSLVKIRKKEIGDDLIEPLLFEQISTDHLITLKKSNSITFLLKCISLSPLTNNQQYAHLPFD